MNYYPFHIGDYSVHTGHLDPIEDLAYRRMLDLYYRDEKPLPSSVEDIGRLIRLRDNLSAIRDVLNEFFNQTDAGWSHARCDQEIAKMQSKQAKAKASAAISVSVRSTNAQRTLNERSASVELPTPTPTPTPIEVNNPPPPFCKGGALFAEFWKAWPAHGRKVAKPQCLKKWQSKNLDAIAGKVIAALDLAKQSEAWKKDGGGFVPSPLVWLNQDRWEAPTEAEAAAEVHHQQWHQTRSGIEAKGVELGLGVWDEYKASVGQGDAFPAYRAKVYRLAGHAE